MTFVDRITKLKHPGTLHNFTWPENLPNFGRYNLIYGWNGSGKTTISRLFRALEMRTAPANCAVEISIYGKGIDGSAFPQTTLPVRVFNRDFVSANVTQTADGDVPPILVLGEDSVEKQTQVAKLRIRLPEAIAETGQLVSRRALLTEEIWARIVFTKQRIIKDTLRSAGHNSYNNYDKSRYRQRAQEMLDSGGGKNHRLDGDAHTSLRSRIHETPKGKIEQNSITRSRSCQEFRTM